MATAKRRVTYILPSPGDNVPRLQLPPHGVSRLGATAPLLMQYRDKTKGSARRDEPDSQSHPRHRLGVASLALDTSTFLAGRPTPEGILYSGGRDGLIMSWDLSVPMKRRRAPERTRRGVGGGWELMTGWDDNVDEEADDMDDRLISDGDVLGDVTASLKKRRRTLGEQERPYERLWETDGAAFQPGTKKTQFRQCAQAHTDWVNDILVCNYNQTVVSASSDGTVKAWSPHSPTSTDPSTIGAHSDYARCLTHCREQNWVASGSFDRTIKLWDLHRTGTDPLVTMYPPDALAPKSSVYAVAADPFGHMVASGSPERVVRLWDPRTGKRTGKLVGHTDNIRAILVSDDSKYLLTGSADASIKLWSLTSQRCLHTFTHHADSVWSLFSDHPSLEVFYSGDRSGLVCRVDVEDCADISEGECVLLCNESAVDPTRPAVEGMGINKIVVMDDNLLWTASGTSTIRRWHIPQRRTMRAGGQQAMTSPIASPQGIDGDITDRFSPSASPMLSRRRPLPEVQVPSEPSTRPPTSHARRLSLAPSVQSSASDVGRERDGYGYGSSSGYGYGPGYGSYTEGDADALRPYDSMVRLVSPHDPFTPFGVGGGITRAGRDPEVATLYSAASVVSVPHHVARALPSPTVAYGMNNGGGAPLSGRTDDALAPNPLSTARALYETRELAADALPAVQAPDDVITGAAGLVRAILLNDRTYALTVDTEGAVAVWDIIRGICLGAYSAEDVAGASHAGSTAGGREEREHSPREALEAVRERIEGEALVVNWCHADTKAGVLSIHLTERCFEAEVYADEVGFVNDRNFNDESKLNMGKWVLRNLFIGFIKEEMRLHHDGATSKSPSRTPSHDTLDHLARSTATSSPSHSADASRRPLRRAGSTTVQCAHNMVPAVLPIVTGPVRASPLLAPLIPLHPHMTEPMPILPASATATMSATPFDVTTPTPMGGFHQRTRSGTLDSALVSTLVTPTPGKALEGDYFTSRVRQSPAVLPGSPDDFSGWGGPGTIPGKPHVPEPPTPSTPSGLIGRLKIFGKSAKRPVSENVVGVGAGAHAALATEPTIPEGAPLVETAQTAAQRVLAGPLEPPTSLDAPLVRMPPNTTVLIAEEAQPSYTMLYRGTVSQTHHDVEALEEAMPLWLLEYLLRNQIPPSAPTSKISFVLIPWNRDPGQEPLPELLNTQQSKLTASRYLRVRKIVVHVQDKLDKLAPASNSRAASVRSLSDPQQEAPQRVHRPRAEDEYEILCNETPLPLGMSLAAIRNYVWKQGTELVLHYRRKLPAAGTAAH